MTATHRVKLVYLVYGPPGAGKSTVAKKLETSFLQSILLSNDTIREHFKCPMDNSVYTNEVYSFVARETARYLDQEQTVIIDATFYSRHYRKIIFEYLRSREPTYILLNIVTPVDICRERVLIRKNNPNLQGMHDIDSFEGCIAETEAWADDDIPNDWHRVAIDCSDQEPRVIKYSRTIPKNILQNIHVALKG